MSSTVEAHAIWPGREEVHLEMRLNDRHEIEFAKLTGIGGPELLDLLCRFRPQMKGRLKALPLPPGTSAAVLCLREAILKAKGEWNFPYQENELCHCRAVLTAAVDQAICTGAHTPQKVSELTSASTACGTCRPNVQQIINYRLCRS